MTYTIAELDHACRWAFNFEPAADMIQKDAGRVTLHRMAIERAFLDNVSGPNADILRQAMRDLSKHGMYKPTDGVIPD